MINPQEGRGALAASRLGSRGGWLRNEPWTSSPIGKWMIASFGEDVLPSQLEQPVPIFIIFFVFLSASFSFSSGTKHYTAARTPSCRMQHKGILWVPLQEPAWPQLGVDVGGVLRMLLENAFVLPGSTSNSTRAEALMPTKQPQ